MLKYNIVTVATSKHFNGSSIHGETLYTSSHSYHLGQLPVMEVINFLDWVLTVLL